MLLDHHTLAARLRLDPEMVWLSLADASGQVPAPSAPGSNDDPLMLDPGLVPELDTPQVAVEKILQRGQDLRWVVCQMRVVCRILWTAQLIDGSECYTYPRRGGYHVLEIEAVWEWASLASESRRLWVWFYLLLLELVSTYQRLHSKGREPRAAAYLRWFGSRRQEQIPGARRRYEYADLPDHPITVGHRAALWRLRNATVKAVDGGWSHAQVLYTMNFRGIDQRRHPFVLALQSARRTGNSESDIISAVTRTLTLMGRAAA